MTAVPDHRPDRVVMACSCGARVELPPVAAEAARSHWDRIHSGPGHQPAEVAGHLVPAAGYARRS